ncbi:BspA family leucine-rich repeat surface protein [Candidatus Saccharibacteria bacterium]|nr:BspA family leucine-rich repeat surface protein [Candidatus Saccharibacteria bacterium]
MTKRCFRCVFKKHSSTKRFGVLYGFCLVLLTIILSNCNISLVSASDYSLSLTTDTDIELNTLAGDTAINESSINVATTCRAGYNLFLTTSVSNNNLYLDGNVDNSGDNSFIAPADGTTALTNAANTWGYLLSSSAPTSDSVFLPVSSSLLNPAILKTDQETASEEDINDSFPIYYGTNVSPTLMKGAYTMIPEDSSTETLTNGGLVYYLTASFNCIETLDINFNQNLDGAGGETSEDPEDTVSNFPAANESTINQVLQTLTLSSKTPTRTKGYLFKEWNTEPDGSGTSYNPRSSIKIGSNTSAGELSGNVTLYAIWQQTITFNFDGNGFYFDENETEETNNITYAATCSTQTTAVDYAIARTQNVNDDGTMKYLYDSNTPEEETITIPDASSLRVELFYGYDQNGGMDVYYGGNSNSGSHYGYFWQNAWENNNEISTDIFTVNSNTVSFLTKRWGPPAKEYYGYYAKIHPLNSSGIPIPYENQITQKTCEYEKISGDYKTPLSGNYPFYKWQADSSNHYFSQEEDFNQMLENGVFNDYLGQTFTFDAVYETVTFNFLGGGLYFDENKTEDINTVTYANTCTEHSAYIGDTPTISKTPNINNDSTMQEYYNSNEQETDTVSFSGANKLKVELTYGYDNNGGMQLFTGIPADDGNYEDDETYYSYFWSGDWEDAEQTSSITLFLDSDTVTFITTRWGEPTKDYYGYHAKVTPIYNNEHSGATYGSYEICGWQTIEGEFKLPILDNIELDNWYISSIDEYFHRESEIISALQNGMGSDLVGQTLSMDPIYNSIVRIDYNSNDLFFDNAETKKTNTVLYSNVCTEQDGEEVCSWQSVAGEYQLPILVNIEFKEWHSDYLGNSFTSESEILEMLESNGDNYYGQTITIDARYNAVTIVYNGNGLYFDESKTKETNTVIYANACQPLEYGYIGDTPTVSKTPNVEDDGSASSGYAYDFTQNDPITIPGADKLKIELSYGIESGYDQLYIFEGTYSGEINENLSAGQIKQFTGGENYDTNTDHSGEATFIVDGNTVSFVFFGNDYEDNGYYGYYAKVYPVYNEEQENTTYDSLGETCGWQAVKGEYTLPILGYSTFSEWYYDDGEGHRSFSNEEDIISALHNSMGEDYSGQTLTLNAAHQDPITFIFNGNGLYFDENETEETNTVIYADTCTTKQGYIGNNYEEVMTSNINTGGIQNGAYTNEEYILETVTIPEANKLKVVVNYGVTGNSSQAYVLDGEWNGDWDYWFSRWDRNRLSSETDTIGTKTYIINDNTTTIYATGWNTPTSGYDYGYYFKIYPIYDEEQNNTTYSPYEICGWQAVEGTYKSPITLESESTFNHWYSDYIESIDSNLQYDDDESQIIDNLSDWLGQNLSGQTITFQADWNQIVNITVNLDEHVRSIGIYDWNDGTTINIVNNNGNGDGTETATISLKTNVSYNISASYDLGYEINTWTTTEGGTLDDSVSEVTNYILTGTATLGLTSKFKQPPISCNTPIPAQNITYMQDITPANKAAVFSSMETNTAYYLRDSRDYEPYCVAKLADGNIWFLDNLRLNITDNEVITNITTANTNASSTTLNYFKNGGGSSSDQYAINGLSGYDWSYSHSYSAPLASTYFKNHITTPRGNGSGKVGIFYNYCAASAGSYCYGNGSSTGSPSGDATEDICPVNWRMPTGGANGEYQILARTITGSNATSYSDTDANNIKNALSISTSGYTSNGSSIDSLNSSSYFWSSTYYDSNYMYESYTASNAVYPQYHSTGSRTFGFSVRCLMESPSHAVTVSLDSGTSSITFTDQFNSTQTATTESPTVSLKEGRVYTIIATIATGYEFSSWSTGANGTLASNLTNPTTYSVTAPTTLTATSEEIPSYAVTVNMDSHSNSVSFYNPDYGTQTATSDGVTVSLRHGADYTITATTDLGYVFANWSTTSNGILASASINPTTYTITGEATLELTSQIPPVPSSCNREITGITYLQDITELNKSTILSGLTTNTAYYLRDSRDNEPYCVAKLADGNLWSLDNLRLDLANPNVIANVTDSNTNASAISLNYLKNGGGTTSDQYATSGLSGSNWTSGYSYSDPLINSSYRNYTATSYGNGSGKTGVYYNYCAASAGSYCYGDGTSAGPSSGNATEDVCPIGWRMPTSISNTGDYQKLSMAINGQGCNIACNGYSATIFREKLSTPLSSYFINGSRITGEGRFWSSSYFNARYMNQLSVDTYSYNVITNNRDRSYGLSVRCLLGDGASAPRSTVTVNLDEHVQSVSFYNAILGAQTITNENSNGDGSHTETVSLAQNATYIISSSFSTGYTTNEWITTTNGILGNNIAAATSYIITGDATLSLTSKQPSYMSNFTTNMCNNLSTNDIIELKDYRDGEIYRIAKLADDNCWMLDNLRLDLTDNTITTNLTSSNTNASNNTLNYLKNGGGTTSDQYAISGLTGSNWTSGYSYSDPKVNNAYKDDTTTSYGNGSGKSGVYYNYCAASAGSYCYGDGTSYTNSPSSDPNTNTLMDTNEDICPAGWRMPTGGDNGEYKGLAVAITNSSSNSYSGTDATNIRNALSTPLSGYINSGSLSNQNSYGYLWSSTYNSNRSIYNSYASSTSVYPQNNAYRNIGYSVRCLLDDHAFSEITVNLDSNINSITFTNPVYGTTVVTSNNSTIELRKGVEYEIKAEIPLGYEFVGWATSENGTLSSTSTNPATFTITSTSTLSATSQAASSYTVTVNLDEHSSSVGFYYADSAVQQIINTNNNGDGTHTGTITLYSNTTYMIAPSFADDYKFSAWSTTTNGTLGNSASTATTYNITGTSTLSLTSISKTGATTLIAGFKLNSNIKSVAEKTIINHGIVSSTIKALRMSDYLPADFIPSDTNTVSTPDSEYPVYVFFDNTNNAGIIYFYTEAKEIYMNANSSSAFNAYAALTDISALSNWNTSNVTDMDYMFASNYSLTNIDALANWDTSNVTDMNGMFIDAISLTNIDGAINWDTSSVTNMSDMFVETQSLTNIDGAINWDTSSVTNMGGMFNACFQDSCESSLANIDGAINWDTSSVTDMGYMFNGNYYLTNIDALANWNTSNVTNMSRMFSGTKSLTNIDGAINWDTSSVTSMRSMFDQTDALANIDGAINWDTSSVTDMSYMFWNTSSLTNIDGAINWDTSSVTDMSCMFQNASSLTNIDGAINWNTSSVIDMSGMFSDAYSLTNTNGANDWDIKNVKATTGETDWSNNRFNYMFYFAGNSGTSEYHPTFTKRSGTWDDNGTFIPDDTTTSTTTITVYFDSNINSIRLSGEFPDSGSYTTQTISTSGDTISLNRGNSYRIFADTTSGYELALWNPGENGIIPSNKLSINSRSGDDNTYFTPTDDTTLTATSQPIPSNVTTTVNMDSNINKVSFCNDKYNIYNTNTFTYDCTSTSTNDNTVTLKQGVTYRVTAATKQGYEISSYTTTGATIANTSGAHTNFTPSGASTLTVTSTTAASTNTVTVNMDSNIQYATFTNPDWPTKVAIRNGSTVKLRENTNYTVTAYTKTGYELATWTTTANGTLSSTSSNPTTYTVSDDTTLTVTSSAIPSYTVTVNMDSNVSSISFYHANYGIQTVSTSGDTVSLKHGTNYTITATYANGYEFDTWSTTANGTLDSASSATTNYSVSGTATLSLTSKNINYTCTKQYRLQNTDGTYPETYTQDGQETNLHYGDTCTYTKSETNYITQSNTVTITEDTTISLDLPLDI